MSRFALLLAIAMPLAACEPTGTVLFPPTPTLPPDAGFDPAQQEIARRELGRLLFFDKILSGDRTMSCASCHVVFLQATEPLPISLGHGAIGVGPTRSDPGGTMVLGRNTPDIFLRTHPNFPSFFWDGRLEFRPDGLRIPENAIILASAAETQALMPLVTAEEMLGTPDDPFNDVARIFADFGLNAALEVYAARLQTTPGYPQLFAQAFPETRTGGIHANVIATALVAFERALWERFDTPADLGLGAEQLGLDPVLVTEGSRLFHGDANCTACHDSAFFSDFRFYNLGVPQFGPGKDPATGLDLGRGRITGDADDDFAFRTPPLRNVALTAPYMHNGAYATLEEVVRHHLDREGSLRSYDPSGLPPELAATMHDSDDELARIAATISTRGRPLRTISDDEILALVEFLKSLTSLEEDSLVPESGVPLAVPSGLPVDVWPGGPHPSRLMNLGH